MRSSNLERRSRSAMSMLDLFIGRAAFALGLSNRGAIAVHAVRHAVAEVHFVFNVIGSDGAVACRAPVTSSVTGVHLRRSFARQTTTVELFENPLAGGGRDSHCGGSDRMGRYNKPSTGVSAPGRRQPEKAGVVVQEL